MMRSILSAAILLLASAPVWAAAQETPTPGSRIPESEIVSLRAAAKRAGTGRASLASRRRACKSVARKGAALVEAHPSAPNRFSVLGIILQCQKRLLGLDNSDRNRKALFKTCGELAEAPVEYAESRLEADMLLSERDLAGRDATLAERADALKRMIARYRDTPGEAKSLMMASVIAPILEARELERAVIKAMDERFSDNTDVISFRRKNLALKSLMVKCKGKYTRVDGTTLFLPADRIGHHSIMVFWSKKSPGFETYLEQVKEHQVRYADMFDVYSFNLDELPDAGEKTLRELGLDWTAMHLPGGRRSTAFRAYGADDPVALLVNAYGYTILTPGSVHSDATVGMRGVRTGAFKINDARISHDRYLAQMQSLFIGDFLVMDPGNPLDPSLPPEMKMLSAEGGKGSASRLTRTEESVPADMLQAIQDCFTAPPFRYRLTRTEARAGYEKAEKLCRDAIARYPDAPDLWLVRNRRIIALLGMWSIACEPKYLEQAVEEAKASLAMDLPRGADVVPRFCLAKDALRKEEPDPESVLPAFIEATGGTRAPPSALAAAAVLALDANSRELHDLYRGKLLEEPGGGSPLLWSFLSFLRDRYHTFHLLVPNYTRGEGRWWRWHIVNHENERMKDLLPKIELKTLDGKTLKLPGDTRGKLTLLVFVEPPADKDADFPVVMDRRGKPTKNDNIRRVMDFAVKLAEVHVNKDVNLVAAFLCDDAKRVDFLMKKNAWTAQAVMVPGGLKNPMVRRLGILSADRLPNVYLLRRDGTIAWRASGLVYKAEFGFPFAMFLGMKVHIEVSEINTAYDALEKGDYKEAARVFAGPYTPWRPQRYGWRTPRYHGKALAHMGLKDWNSALEAIDSAIDAHKLRYFRGRRNKRIEDWRKDASKVVIRETCDIFAELYITKAIILEQLDRREEAAALRELAAGPVKVDGESPYKRFHEKLKKLRLGRHWDDDLGP